jgi:hypothetical protein
MTARTGRNAATAELSTRRRVLVNVVRPRIRINDTAAIDALVPTLRVVLAHCVRQSSFAEILPISRLAPGGVQELWAWSERTGGLVDR